jgi:hypothetical protein
MTVKVLVLSAALGLAAAADSPLAGRWSAAIVSNNVEIPFAFEVTGEGSTLKGSFFNGERRITSTSTTVEDGLTVFNFDQYASKLRVALKDGALSGEYRRARGGPFPFKAARGGAGAPAGGPAGGRPRRPPLKPHPSTERGSSAPRATRARWPGASSSNRTAPMFRPPSCGWTATPVR